MERLSLSLGVMILTLTVAAAGWTFAQGTQAPPPAPTVISGTDIGFRVDAQATANTGRLTGAWVVRVNGQWVEPEPLRMSRPLGTR